MLSPGSLNLYCIHPNGYLVNAQLGGVVFSGHHFSSTQTSHTFHALHAAVGAAMIFSFTHQSLSLDLAALPLTRFLTKFKFDFRMRLGATQKSHVRLVRLLRKLSNVVGQMAPAVQWDIPRDHSIDASTLRRPRHLPNSLNFLLPALS
jgi:hypothetical protein